MELTISVASITIATTAVIMAFLNIRAVSRQTRAAALLGCLERYLDIRRVRATALETNNVELARQYYRELIDLCWTEFRLWQEGLIPKAVFRCWVDSRHRSYKDQRGVTIETEDGETLHITQQEMWSSLIVEKYFGQHDDFTAFIETIHDGEIDKALKRYRRQRIH